MRKSWKSKSADMAHRPGGAMPGSPDRSARERKPPCVLRCCARYAALAESPQASPGSEMEASDARARLLVDQLAKKATFAGAARGLRELAEADAAWAGSIGAFLAAQRCWTLLRARHTGASFWSAGAALLGAVLERAPGRSQPQRDQLSGWLQECSAAADQPAGRPPPPPALALFEGQLSRVGALRVAHRRCLGGG